MNFTDRVEGQEILVELKYCERCGGLFLRPQETHVVFCDSCRAHLAARPDPGKAAPRQPRRRTKVRARGADVVRGVEGEGLQSAAQIEYLRGVAAMEVWA